MSAAEFPLDPSVFWETVAGFARYDYSFPNAGGAGHCPDPSARPGYPGDLVSRAKDRAPGLAGVLDADAAEATNYLGRRYTNCCMFVEAVLVDTALRTHAEFGPQWASRNHAWAMNFRHKDDKEDCLFGPPRAYADAGIADEPLDIAATTKLAPGEIYVIQGLGHTWFIVDCDDTGLCLRLEATFASGLHPELAAPVPGAPATKPFYGGVAHGGFRRVGPAPVRDEWVPALRAHGNLATRWTWDTLRAGLLRDLATPGGGAYVSMARVRMRPTSAGPWLPYATVDASGRPLEGQAALADAWGRAQAAGAPFPLGINRTWHNGIHLHAAADTPVFPFASGELVAARFPDATGDGVDQGAVIVRHRFDRTALAFLAIDEPARDDEAVFYSAIVHMRGGAAGAKGLVDGLCPPTDPPCAKVPAQAKLDVFAFGSDGVAHELGASAWANDVDRPLPSAVELPGIAPRLAVHLEKDEQHAAAWTLPAPGPISAPEDAKGGLFDTETHAVWELAAPWSSAAVVLRCDVDGDGRWSARTLMGADGRTWLAPATAPRCSGKPQCVHAAAERTAMSAAASDVLVTRAGRARFTVTVGDTVRTGTVELPRMVVAVVGAATPASAPTHWRACVKVTAAEITAGTASGASHTIALHDPSGGRVFVTKVPVGVASVALVGPVPGQPRFAYVVGSSVTLGCDSGCCHGVDDVAAIGRHVGGADVGTFVDPEGVAVLVGKAAARLVATRMHAGVDARGTLALQACVGLDDDELAALHEELGAMRRAAGGDVADRLRAGTSRLVALPLGTGGYTVGTDGCVQPPAAANELTLHDDLRASHGDWWFDRERTQTLPAMPAALSWPVLRVIRQPGKTSVRAAIVEVVLAAPRDRFDDSAKQHWDRIDGLRRRVQRDLVAGWVDFAEVEGDDPETTPSMRWHRWRWLKRQVIGLAGCPRPEHGGVHLEVFAEKPVLDRGIANGRWEEFGADVDAAPRTVEFERAVAKLLAEGRFAQLPIAMRLREEIARGARRPETWAAFCNDPDVMALLAELVAVHDNEWTTPWTDVLAPRDRGGPGLAHAPLADAWPADPGALGLPSGKLRYHHPLRLYEWLTTGLEARIHLLQTASEDVTASLAIAGEELECIGRVGGGEARFELRAVLARALPTAGALVRTGVLTVHHTRAAIPQVPVTLRRGEITRLELCEPGATVQRAAAGIEGGDNGFLLADATQRFGDVACNRAAVTITLFFNRDRPAKVELSIDHANFAIVALDDDAYTHSGDARRCTFVPVAGTTAPAVPTATTVRLQVAITAGTAVGVTGRLTVTIAGADGNPGITETIEVGTRELGAAANERGRDVEKLQLYLSRILAEGAPCYRKDRKPGAAWRVGTIDGVMRSTAVLALWRFILTFGGKGPWAAGFTSIRCEKGVHAIPNRWSGQQFEIPAPLDADGRLDALDAEAARLMARLGRPIVDAAMIAELVRAAAMPHVMPRLSLAIGAARVAAPLSAAAGSLAPQGRALLLPLPALVPEQSVTIGVTAEPVAGDPASVTLEIVLGGTAYALPSGAAARRTLADLLAHGVVLVASGAVDGGAHELALRQGASVLAEVALPGTRDLFATDRGAGVDALYVQRWLTIHRDADDKPYLAAATGKWDRAGQRALARFRADHLEPTADFSEVAAALAAPPAPPAAGATAGPVPAAAGSPP